jgi:hypothetical protein
VQDYKLANFKKLNPSEDFPVFRRVGSEESRQLAARLAQRLRLPVPFDPLKLVRRVQSCLTTVPGVSSLSEDFRLSQVLWQFRLPAPECVFVNWYQFDDVDEIRFDELDSHFADVWYPSSDDIEVFDASLTWLIAIAHDGSVGICRT